MAAQVRPFRRASPPRRGSHDRPSGTPSRSRRERRRARPRPFRRTGCVSRALHATFPSSATPRTMPLAEPGRPRDDSVGSVRTDEVRSAHRRRAADACGHAVVVELDVAHGDSVAEVRSGGRRLLGEMEVEPAPLRHLDERLALCARSTRLGTRRARPSDRRRAPRPRRRRRADAAERRPVRPPPHGLSRGKRALSTRRTRAPGPCEVDRRGRSCRPGTDDEHVEALHPAIVGRAASRGYNCAPRRDSRVAKGGGL